MRLAPIAAILATAAAATTAHATPPPGAVVKQVQDHYAKLAHLHAHFRQDVTNATFGQTKTSDGTVWLARPASMRWIYASPRDPKKIKREFVSDGKTLWMIDHENLEVIVQPVAGTQLPAAAAFLLGGNLTSSYTVAIDASGTYGAKTDVVLALTPKHSSAQVAKLELVVDPTDGHVSQSIVTDSNGDVNHFTFDQVDEQTAPPAGIFTVNTNAMTTYKIVTLPPATPPPPAAPTP